MDTSTLESICSRVSSGGTPSRKRAEYFTADLAGHLWVKSKELLDGSIHNTEERITDEGLNESAAKYFPANTVLVAMYGANVGQLGWLRRPATVNQAICGLVVDEKKADWRYVFYSLLQNRGDLTVKAQGAAQQNLNQDLIRQFPLTLPPLPVQRRIAGILSAYDELMENSQRRIRLLEAMARAIYREWFVHFRFPGHEKIKRIASPLGDIPKGWQAIPFETLLASMTGGDWGSDQTTETESAEVTIVRGTDFDEVAYGDQLRAPVRYIKPSSLKSRELRPGDVIVENSINAKSRCIGTTLLVDSRVLARIGRDAVAASFCKVFRLHDPRLAPLVHLHFRRLREDARMEYYQNVAANGIGNFQAKKFAMEENLILPTDESLCSKLIGAIAAIFDSVGVISSQLCNLRRTRDLLLPRLLSGQVELKEN